MMEGDPVVDGSSVWRDGDTEIQRWMNPAVERRRYRDTEVDGSSGEETEIQRYRGGGKETLRWGENAVLRPLIEDPALAGGGGKGRGPKARYYETLEPH
jgi:hypothetical protein